MQTFDKITTYPYGTHNFKVCESEMMMVRSLMLEKAHRFPILWWYYITKKWVFEETSLRNINAK